MDNDKVIQKLIVHDEQLSFIRENMATGSDIREIKSVLESLVTIVEKIDEYICCGVVEAVADTS